MKKLLPCPFCGGEAGIERTGTPRQSCIVACVNCGARHESGDEAQFSGASWNRRTQPAPAITSETGNQAAQGASAITSESVPLLSEQEIVKCLSASGCVGAVKMSYDSGPYEITRTSVNADRLARAIEQAVRSKLGAGVPMTDEQIIRATDEIPLGNGCFVKVVRAAEKFHGIVGKECWK